jgi:endonuclease YncB( thermonuclease family)
MIPFLLRSWRRSRGWACCLAALLIATAGFSATTEPAPKKRAPAKKPKTWESFEKCTYLENTSNDGDSFQVRHGKKTLHVRLYFVDAPETNLADPERVIEQSQHFGITQAATLQAGKKAAEVTRQFLSQSFTVHTRWTVAGGRSRQPRYYAIVAVSGRDLGELLVSQGLARTKGAVAPTPDGEPSKSVMARLQQLESEARRQRFGAWSASSHPPAPGSDGKSTSTR